MKKILICTIISGLVFSQTDKMYNGEVINQKNITEKQVIDIIREFFDAFDTKNENRNEKLSNIVTDDFIICELGKFYKLDEFLDFIEPMQSGTISREWTLTDHIVTIDNNTAHSFHNNSGIFTKVDQNGIKTKTDIKWLESALVVNEDGNLKIKYYQSENIYTNVDTIQIVEAACGQCQFNMTEKSGCDLAVRMNGKSYFVEGTKIDDHGDAHADDGFCSTVRTARVKGEIVEGRFKVESFELTK